MLQSMTGYGKVNGNIINKKIQIEIKALNSKNLDIFIKLPSAYKEFELIFRQIISDKLERGKIEVFINIENELNNTDNSINYNIFQSYYNELKTINSSVKQENIDYFSLILKMPDIFITKEHIVDDNEKNIIENYLIDACNKVTEFRKKEGKELEIEFTSIINRIKELLIDILPFEKNRIETIKHKFRKGFDEWSSEISIDDNRFEQELLYYLEKIDINEEKMRLLNHLNYFLDCINISSSGKKLGFIAQEIGREINTLGSKSYQYDMQKIVVEMKDNLEKLKEQILNTL